MCKTRHFGQRMNIRGIQQEIVDIVFKHGTETDGKLVITKKDSQAAIKEIDKLRKAFVKLCDKDGVAIAADGNELITAMNLHSSKRSIYS